MRHRNNISQRWYRIELNGQLISIATVKLPEAAVILPPDLDLWVKVWTSLDMVSAFQWRRPGSHEGCITPSGFQPWFSSGSGLCLSHERSKGLRVSSNKHHPIAISMYRIIYQTSSHCLLHVHYRHPPRKTIDSSPTQASVSNVAFIDKDHGTIKQLRLLSRWHRRSEVFDPFF
jgi:hypothetical protein